jgi:excisionase family DNA binding protein
MNEKQQRRITMESKYLDITNASKYLGIGKSTLRAMVSKKTVPHIRLGDRVLFSTEKLDQWLDSKCQGGKK